ncbi:MAG: fibronectin type III domain-containing protein [Polyangiaceae bacterium]|nr:fibronectin type III domain-containing protein [Polyangiaceae bacterium]
MASLRTPSSKNTLLRLAMLSVGFGALLGASDAQAVGTRTFQLDKGEDFKGGDLKGVAVDASGKVRAGLSLGASAVNEASAIWAALPEKDGAVLLGTGNEGKLLRLKDGKVSVVAETKALVITSLVEAWGGTVVMGTMPDGKVMKLDRGKVTDLVSIKGVEHIWSVAFDKKSNSVFAATGPEGKLYRVDQNGTAQVYFDAAEQHLMSVAVAPDGTVYAGASEKAKLYKITGPGRGTVMHDFGRTEVRAISVNAKGEVYSIANEIQSASFAPKRSGSMGPAAAGPTAKPPKTSGKGTLVHFAADGTPDVLLDDKTEHFTSLTLGDDGKPYVGTGVEGRVYTVDDAHNSVLMADTEERQIGALSLGGKTKFVAASDPAVLHPVRGVGGTDSVWTSKVLDAGIRARWGRMSWVSSGTLELSTRSGNTKEPDDTWSAWGKGMAAPGAVDAPAARFFQVRARWNKDASSVLSELTVPFVTDNLRAVITGVDAGPKSASSSGDSVPQSGGPVDGSASSKLNLTWRVDNPDKDKLRYRVQYRLVGATTWYELLKPGEKLTSESYSWETATLPEGEYRIRVTASDELSNPPARVRKHSLESGIVLVDNTPPRVEGLTIAGKKVQGRAIDGVGPIQRIEVSVAGSDDWYPFEPKDGIFDEQSEEFEADVSSFAPAGPALLSVRVYDKANNFVVRNVSLK